MDMHNPPHPGEVLREYMGPTNDVAAVASRLGITRQTLYRLLNGQNAVTAQMAISLEQVFKASARMWLGMQAEYDLWNAREDRREAAKQELPGPRSAWGAIRFTSRTRPGRLITLKRSKALLSADKGEAKLQKNESLLRTDATPKG
jgi:addiction module HigA family antidote